MLLPLFIAIFYKTTTRSLSAIKIRNRKMYAAKVEKSDSKTTSLCILFELDVNEFFHLSPSRFTVTPLHCFNLIFIQCIGECVQKVT